MCPVLQPMTFEELSQIHREEMKVKALTSCRPDLYRAMADLLNRLKMEYTRQLSIDPDSVMSEGANLHRKNAETIAKVIINLRARKIATKAVLSADGANEELGPLTPEEREYYYQLVEISRKQLSLVDRYRGKNVVDTHIDEPIRAAEPVKPALEPIPNIPVDEPMPEEEPFPEEPEMFDDMVVEESFDDVPEPESVSPQAEVPEPAQPEPVKVQSDTMLIRVLEDLPAFVGPDRDYELHKEDVVTLTTSMAELLIKTGKAIEIAPSP